jgi:hypothetical protein
MILILSYENEIRMIEGRLELPQPDWHSVGQPWRGFACP